MSVDLKPVETQTIVITGATSGIGLETAQQAAMEGARLVLAARNEEALAEVKRDLDRLTEVETVVADVGVEAEVRRIAEAAHRRFGGFDTWVNNAGLSIYGTAMEVTVEDHRRLFDTNYWGVVYGSRIAAETLRHRGGAIVNLGSILSDRAIPLQGPYCASKFAVKAFTDVLRMELAHEGAPVSVTLIKPSGIDTPFIQHAKNYMDVEPVLPPPVYAPRLVAEAILHAAAHPTRDLTVGGGGWLIGVVGDLFPAVSDAGMVATMFKAQQRDIPKDPRTGDSLHRPGQDGRVRGTYPGPVMKTSLFTQAQTNPGFALAAVAGVAALALAAKLAFPARDET